MRRIAGLTLIVGAGVWLFAAAAVGVAIYSLVDESGWAELPAFAWIMAAIVFGVAPLVLLYGGYRWRLGWTRHD